MKLSARVFGGPLAGIISLEADGKDGLPRWVEHTDDDGRLHRYRSRFTRLDHRPDGVWPNIICYHADEGGQWDQWEYDTVEYVWLGVRQQPMTVNGRADRLELPRKSEWSPDREGPPEPHCPEIGQLVQVCPDIAEAYHPDVCDPWPIDWRYRRGIICKLHLGGTVSVRWLADRTHNLPPGYSEHYPINGLYGFTVGGGKPFDRMNCDHQ